MVASKLVQSCCIMQLKPGERSVEALNGDPECIETKGESGPVNGNGDTVVETNGDPASINRERESEPVWTGVSVWQETSLVG